MLKIRDMMVEDVETVARMVALDHDDDREKGYRSRKAHAGPFEDRASTLLCGGKRR